MLLMLLVAAAGGSGLIRVSWHDPCNRSGSPPTPPTSQQVGSNNTSIPTSFKRCFPFIWVETDLHTCVIFSWGGQQYQRWGPKDMFKPINCVVYKIIRQNHIKALVRGAHKAAPYGHQAVSGKNISNCFVAAQLPQLGWVLLFVSR